MEAKCSAGRDLLYRQVPKVFLARELLRIRPRRPRVVGRRRLPIQVLVEPVRVVGADGQRQSILASLRQSMAENFEKRAAHAALPEDNLLNLPSTKPTQELDFAITAPGGSWTNNSSHPVAEMPASAHRPVLAVLSFRPVRRRRQSSSHARQLAHHRCNLIHTRLVWKFSVKFAISINKIECCGMIHRVPAS